MYFNTVYNIMFIPTSAFCKRAIMSVSGTLVQVTGTC